MRLLSVVVLALLVAPAWGAETVTFFPATPLFPRVYADATTHQFGFSKDLLSANIYGSIGNQISVFEVECLGTVLQAGAGGTVFASIIKKPRLLDVVTVDFLVEFPFDVRLTDRLAFRTGYGHFSAHFADDGIEILGRSSVNYAKDYIMALAAYRVPAWNIDLYGGAHWDYHSIPEEQSHWSLQAGIQGGDISLCHDLCAYGAVDIQFKSEVAWATTQSYQCGVKLFPRGSHVVRFAYTFRTGMDGRGQFFRERTASHLVGVYLDF
jgi:hypothetical protein